MPRRSTAKPTPQPQAATTHDVQATHYPGWAYQEHFGGFLLKPTFPADPSRIHIHIQGRALTISFGPSKADNKLAAILKVFKRSPSPEYVASRLFHRFILPEIANLKTTKAVWCGDTLSIRFAYNDVEVAAVRFPMVDPDNAPRSSVVPVPIDFGTPDTPIIPLHKTTPNERKMAQADNITVAKDGTLVKGGVRYRSLYAAAPSAQTHPTTLLNWIKNATKLNGRTLQAFYFAPADKYFISEESIERASNRFVKWPSQEPAGVVTLGETDNRSGYIGLPQARGILGISNRTMYLWAAHGKAPTTKPLDVIKDPISEHLYIRESDVYDLKKLVPRSGLHRGRRPLPALQPL